MLLHRRDALDVWLLCWLDTQETGLHDHDRSAGAFYVCEGALAEDVLRVESTVDPRREREAARAVASDGTSMAFRLAPATHDLGHVYSPASAASGHLGHRGSSLRPVDDGLIPVLAQVARIRGFTIPATVPFGNGWTDRIRNGRLGNRVRAVLLGPAGPLAASTAGRSRSPSFSTARRSACSN